MSEKYTRVMQDISRGCETMVRCTVYETIKLRMETLEERYISQHKAEWLECWFE